MKRILVPIDGSKHADLALERAGELAEKFGSDIVLINVNDFHQHMFNYNSEVESNFFEKFDEISNDILKDGKEKLESLGDRVTSEKLEGGVANKVIEYANNNNFDLVIIGSHGKGAIHKFLMGSVAQKIALHINKTVMIVRAED